MLSYDVVLPICDIAFLPLSRRTLVQLIVISYPPPCRGALHTTNCNIIFPPCRGALDTTNCDILFLSCRGALNATIYDIIFPPLSQYTQV